eukprot:COSAG01_NODE_10065_length_2258_cov_2.805465_3_plen_110_part_00
MYPASWRNDRRWYAAMTTYWDTSLGNITDAIKAKAMWNRTLLVLTSDNGGPAYWSGSTPQHDQPRIDHYPIPGGSGKPPSQGYQHGGGANNWPLKGSKVSNWEVNRFWR